LGRQVREPEGAGEPRPVHSWGWGGPQEGGQGSRMERKELAWRKEGKEGYYLIDTEFHIRKKKKFRRWIVVMAAQDECS